MIMWTTALFQRNVFKSILSFIIELLMYNYNEEKIDFFLLTGKSTRTKPSMSMNRVALKIIMPHSSRYESCTKYVDHKYATHNSPKLLFKV